jgi:hypothetical protein
MNTKFVGSKIAADKLRGLSRSGFLAEALQNEIRGY